MTRKGLFITIVGIILLIGFNLNLFEQKETPIVKYEYSIVSTEPYNFSNQKRTKFLLTIDNSKFKTTEEAEKAYISISNELKVKTESDEVFVLFYNDSIQALSNCWQLARICLNDINTSKNEVAIRPIKNYSSEELSEKDGLRVNQSDSEGKIIPPTKKEGEIFGYMDNLLWTTSLEDDIIYTKTSEKFGISKKKVKDIYNRLSFASII